MHLVTKSGFYTDQIGVTDMGPVYLYFDPQSEEFRPVIVPASGDPYYAPPGVTVRRELSRPGIEPMSAAVVGGSFGALLGGPVGAAVGGVLGLALSHLAQDR